jgi:transposase
MKRLPMRKIREALRLRADGFSGRRVAQSLSIGRATISEYFRRADLEDLSWLLPADLSDVDLERRLFPYSPGEARLAVPLPDWAYVHAELRRKGVTLSLLWEEYRGVHPDGYSYSRYFELYTRWEGKLSPVMHQRHPAGERLFVDYAGHTVDVVCPKTGEVPTAQIFVATLGASSYTSGQNI